MDEGMTNFLVWTFGGGFGCGVLVGEIVWWILLIFVMMMVMMVVLFSITLSSLICECLPWFFFSINWLVSYFFISEYVLSVFMLFLKLYVLFFVVLHCFCR